MSSPKSAATRRGFLGSLGAIGAAGATRTFSGTLLAHPPGTAPQTNGAVQTLLPRYVYGKLADCSQKRVTISLPENYSPPEISVAVTPQTEICRLGCNRSWRALKTGDRIEVGYEGSLGVDAAANWANANPVYNYGLVADVGVTSTAGPGGAKRGWPQVTVAINFGRYDQPEFYRDIIISPGTKVVLASGRTSYGSAAGIKVGKVISFTATADVPYLKCRTVWGWAIHQLESM